MSFLNARRQAETAQDEPSHSLTCQAHGCPLQWGVDKGNRLCSYHAWSEAKDWPAITESLGQRGPWELNSKKEISTKNHQGDPKGWAKRLLDLHKSGASLSPFQAKCYQDALGITAGHVDFVKPKKSTKHNAIEDAEVF